jgi:CRISPR system Cascade subunit CasB
LLLALKEELYGFVRGKIKQLDDDTPWARGMCAKLRRGIGKSPGELPELWAATLANAPDAWDGRDGVASKEQNAIHTALTLYALHRQGKNAGMSKEGGDSLGGAAARLVTPDKGNLDAVKRRFDAVATASGFLELSHHARGVIQMLKASPENLTMDYPSFAVDLYFYQIPTLTSRVRLSWGQDFYRVLGRTEDRKEVEA